MDIQDQYLDIQLWDSRLIYSVVISRYLARDNLKIKSKIKILLYLNSYDIGAEFLDNRTEYIKWLYYSGKSIY